MLKQKDFLPSMLLNVKNALVNLVLFLLPFLNEEFSGFLSSNK